MTAISREATSLCHGSLGGDRHSRSCVRSFSEEQRDRCENKIVLFVVCGMRGRHGAWMRCNVWKRNWNGYASSSPTGGLIVRGWSGLHSTIQALPAANDDAGDQAEESKIYNFGVSYVRMRFQRSGPSECTSGANIVRKLTLLCLINNDIR